MHAKNAKHANALVEKLQKMTPDKNAPMAVFLSSDAAAGISG